ncbi:putative elongator complex protein 2, partial [Trichinella murrelli]
LATSEAYAKIFLWSTVDWRLKTSLEGHKLTDTRICFSHDDLMILSASRDRRWCLFSRQSDRGVVAGLNNGNIYGLEWNRKNGEHRFIFNMTQFNLSHSSTVSRLKFSPLIEEDENGELTTQLAS